jgi:hypothetical protein
MESLIKNSLSWQLTDFQIRTAKKYFLLDVIVAELCHVSQRIFDIRDHIFVTSNISLIPTRFASRRSTSRSS